MAARRPATQAQWSSCPAKVSLPDNEVHVWAVSLDVAENIVTQLSSSLSTDERQRASCFRFEVDRRRFIVARGKLRQLLARYVAQSPSELAFRYGANGKPALINSGLLQMEFNVSHSCDMAVYAFCCRRPVGVDVEELRPLSDLDQMAGQFLSPEQIARINQCSDDERFQEFYRCWTRYEAVFKCTGEGIATEMDREKAMENFNGRVQEFEPAENFIGAVAVMGKDFEIKFWREDATDDGTIEPLR